MIKKRKREKIKHKVSQIGANKKRCLKMPIFGKTYTFFTTNKAYFIFYTLQINLSFLSLKVVSSSSKYTNNPPLI